jgi:hypothetical protein
MFIISGRANGKGLKTHRLWISVKGIINPFTRGSLKGYLWQKVTRDKGKHA